jgi:hypothetical protein
MLYYPLREIATAKLSIADTIWLATALLHRAHPHAKGFSHETILRKVAELDQSLNPRSVSTHLSTHCVASKKANPATLRILSEEPDGSLRLFRAGDSFHPSRSAGRSSPKPSVLPPQYEHLLRNPAPDRSSKSYDPPAEDPILAISGVGKEMWKRLGGGEAFIRALRTEVFPGYESSATPATDPGQVWARIEAHRGEEFRTVRGEPFSYDVHGNIVVPRPQKGELTPRQLPRSDFEKAWARRPLSGPGQIKDLQGPSYIYGILTDPRITAS